MGVLKTKRDGQVVAFRLDREAIILGSGRDCTIKVPDAVPRHCQIVKMANGFVLRDLSGPTGTFVNGKKIKEHLLSGGDVIQLGTERFTFANEAGANTARVAVPASAAAPASGGTASRPVTARMAAAAPPPTAPPTRPITQKIAAAPPTAERKTTTRAMPTAAAPPTRPITSKVAAVPPAKTGSTGRVPAAQPANGRAPTQRLSAATTRRMPSRTTGRIKKTGGFSLPTTRKGKIIAVCVALGVAGAIGIFGFLYMNREDPEKIKGELAKDLVQFRALAKDEKKVLEADRFAEEMLANVLYRKYDLTALKEVEKAHKKLHDAAGEQRQAEGEVGPFLRKWTGIKGGPPEKIREAATSLYDECRSLSDKYMNTGYASDLKTAKDEIMKYLGDAGPKWEVEIYTMRAEVKKMTNTGKFKSALAAVNEFGKKFEEDKKQDLFKQLEEDRGSLKRQAKPYVDKLGKQAAALVADGKKADAKKLFEEEKPELEGDMFKDALNDLDERVTKLNSEK